MKKQFIKTQSGLHVPKSLQNQPLAIQQLLNFRGACSLISSGILADCDTKPVAGTETEIFLANREDIVDLDYNISNSMIVEGINMVALKKFYKFKGIKQSNNPSAKMNKSKYVNNWIHLLDFLIFANDGAAKKLINDLSSAEVVAIVQNKWKGASGNMAYEMLGFSAGLVLVAAERNPNDAETAGAWKLSLGQDEGQFEDLPPLTIFDTDLATTTSLITALL